MKLRNKKTGKVVDIVVMPVIGGYPDEHEIVDGEVSLSKFNEFWEDYIPKGPLIKDEKIHKCVELWAELNEYNDALLYAEDEEWCSFYEENSQNELLFEKKVKCANLQDHKYYTIDELCGEDK